MVENEYVSLNSKKLNNIKLKMINGFLDSFNELYDEFKKTDMSFDKFLRYKKSFIVPWNFSRVDVKNFGKGNSVALLDANKISLITYPVWLNDDNGGGLKFETTDRIINLQFKCHGDGKLRITLRGRDFRDFKGFRIPVYINYKKLIVNNEIIFFEDNLIWHDEPYDFNIDCKNEDIFNVEIEFETIYDYFFEILSYMEAFDNSELENEYIMDNFKKYVNNKKLLLEQLEIFENIPDEDYSSYSFNNFVHDAICELSSTVQFLHHQNIDLNKKLEEAITLNENISNSNNMILNTVFKYFDLHPGELIRLSRSLTLELLDFIDNVCKKHNLKWWLEGGTLLGAYRHGGFIPWDDDCDIAMLREDYEKFLKIFPKEIDNYNLQNKLFISTSTITNTGVYLPFIKIDYKIDKKLLSFIDVFADDYILENFDENIEKIYYSEAKKARRILQDGEDRNVVIDNFANTLKLSNVKTGKLIRGFEPKYFVMFESNTIFPLKSIKFEDRSFPCPNDLDEYLTLYFDKDFKHIPKAVYNHGFFDHMSKYGDEISLLKDNIKLLKEINSQFKL